MKNLKASNNKNNKSEEIAKILLGKPILSPILIPVTHSSTPNCINSPFMINGESYLLTCVSFGNPHAAVFFDDLDNMDISHLGSLLENHSLFPKGASIVFVQVLDNHHIKARIWQQGEGEIGYSIQGAGVAYAAAIMTQQIFHDTSVEMPGGTFNVEWDRGKDLIYLTGKTQLF